MNGKWITLISFFLFTMAGLVGAAFTLNWLTATFIGPEANRGAPVEEDPKKRGEEYKERQKEYKSKLAKHTAKERASPNVLAEVAREDVPAPLTASEFDPRSGIVAWPDLLLRSDYEQPRHELEHLLKEHANNAADDQQAQAHAAAEQMLSILKDHVRDLPANEYIAAHKFLDSLAHALRP